MIMDFVTAITSTPYVVARLVVQVVAHLLQVVSSVFQKKQQQQEIDRQRQRDMQILQQS